MITDFDTKFKKLPDSIQRILIADFQRIISFEIGKQYKLTPEQISSCNEIISEIYLGDQPLNSLLELLVKRLHVSQETAKKLACDLIGRKILVAANYFNELKQNPGAVIKSYNGNADTYSKDVALLQQAVAEEQAGTYNHDAYLYRNDQSQPKPSVIVEDQEQLTSDLTPEEEALALKDFLENHLLLILQPEASETLSEINDSLLATLSSEENRQEIQKSLENNKTLIGSTPLMFDGKNVPQTVASWLRDFYTVIGTERFDSLAITNYFIQSSNAKKLPEADQLLLRHFFLLYYNIKNFATIFGSLSAEQKQIIPGLDLDSSSKLPTKEMPTIPIYNPSKENQVVIRKVATPLKPITKKSLINTPVKNISSPSTADKVLPSSNITSPEILSLKNMLLQYPPNSLERQAIEEEIKTLEAKSH